MSTTPEPRHREALMQMYHWSSDVLFNEAKIVNIVNNDYYDEEGFVALALEGGIYTFRPWSHDTTHEHPLLTYKINVEQRFHYYGQPMLLEYIKATKDNNLERVVIFKSIRAWQPE